MASVESPVRWRTANACRRCRQRKVKCSGVAPCLNCVNRHQYCIFDEVDRRVVISERHLRELQRRRATASHSQSPHPTIHVASSAITRDHERQHEQSIQPNVRHQTVTPDQRVSTWALSQEARQILDPASGQQCPSLKNDKFSSYAIPLLDESESDPSALSLPPNDQIIYLAHVANFHLNANFCMFNHTVFLEQLQRSSQSVQALSEVWRVKLLIVIALGKLFLERGPSQSGPPGTREFLQAMRALPANTSLCDDPITAVESTCLLAVYAQAAGMHTTAYLYAGQASRLARAYGLDRESHLYDKSQPGEQNLRERLWWTVCILDQRHSASIGACPDHIIQEQNEVGHGLNIEADSTSNFTWRFNLAVANRLTRVMTVLSKTANGASINTLLLNDITKEVMALKRLGQVMRKASPLCHGKSLQTISRAVATLHLSYYHCLILATKPVLAHLAKLRPDQYEPPTLETVPIDRACNMLGTGVNAACTSLSIISALHEQHLLEAFLFQGLEITYLSALLLVLANRIAPKAADFSFIEVAKTILQDMSNRGNIAASALKDELDDICRLISSFHASRDNCHTSVRRETITIVRDGEYLNNAIFEVIEMQPEVTRTNYEAGAPQTRESDISMGHPEVHLEAETVQISAQNHSWELPPLREDGNSSQADETNVAENQFTFDMLNLQWLDSVQ